MAFGRLKVDELETSTQTVSVDALVGIVADGDKGDITISGSGTVWSIDNGAVDTAALGGDITAAGKALLDDADAAAQRTTLGLGGSATLNVGTTAGTVAAGDDGRFTTDLTYTAGTRVLASSTGADATLPLFTSTDAGLTPLSGGGTTNFLRADGTWAAPVSGGTPGGTTGQIQWNSAGSFAGIGGSTVGATGNITLSLNGAASTPPLSFTGTWFTGGTSTTTKPHVLIEPAGTTSTAWSTSGTGLGVNAPSGFTGNLLDLQVAGSSKFNVDTVGNITVEDGAWLTSKTDDIRLSLNSFGSGNFTVSKGSATDANMQFQVRWASPVGVSIKKDIPLSWGDLSSSPTNTLVLIPDAANILAQRRGTDAQTYRLYNTYTDDSNYERLSTTWDTNVCYTKPENAGTGSARIYVPVTGATTVSALPAASTAGAGARAFVTDANSTTFLATAVGGGANSVPVVSDGTNWLIG